LFYRDYLNERLKGEITTFIRTHGYTMEKKDYRYCIAVTVKINMDLICHLSFGRDQNPTCHRRLKKKKYLLHL